MERLAQRHVLVATERVRAPGVPVPRRFYDLFRHVESLARADATVCGLRLYMEHDNHQARGAYLRLGFSPAGYEVFTSPSQRATPSLPKN